jgi:RNA-directed DNA polymerase
VFYALKRKAAPGVDGVTWQDYETELEPRLEDLHRRVHRKNDHSTDDDPTPERDGYV